MWRRGVFVGCLWGVMYESCVVTMCYDVAVGFVKAARVRHVSHRIYEQLSTTRCDVGCGVDGDERKLMVRNECLGQVGTSFFGLGGYVK